MISERMDLKDIDQYIKYNGRRRAGRGQAADIDFANGGWVALRPGAAVPS